MTSEPNSLERAGLTHDEELAKLRAKVRMARRFTGVHPSLVDVMLSLVFMYMLTSLLVVTYQNEARERTLPPVNLAGMSEDGGARNNNGTKGVIVSVKPGPSYFVDKRPVSLGVMSTEFSKSQPQEVEVRGDEAVPYGTVMNVMRVCREAGISRIALTYKIQ
jgi:biopolymer transport protein ExbD